MYRLSAFYFARTASDLPIDCTIPTFFIIIVYFMGGLRWAPQPSCNPMLVCVTLHIFAELDAERETVLRRVTEFATVAAVHTVSECSMCSCPYNSFNASRLVSSLMEHRANNGIHAVQVLHLQPGTPLVYPGPTITHAHRHRLFFSFLHLQLRMRRYQAGAFFANWAAVLLSLLTAQSIGLLVGSVITHPKTGQTITTIVALTMVLVGSRHPQISDHALHSLTLQAASCRTIVALTIGLIGFCHLVELLMQSIVSTACLLFNMLLSAMLRCWVCHVDCMDCS